MENVGFGYTQSILFGTSFAVAVESIEFQESVPEFAALVGLIGRERAA